LLKKMTPYGFMVLLSSAMACSGLCSCAAEDTPRLDARALWLRETLIADNRDLMEREPALTQGKLLKMATTPFNYFRGTAAIYMRDTLANGPYNTPTALLNAQAMTVPLVGDPHPENLGTFLDAQGQMALDINDLDGATYGPYLLDVRRLALGFWILGQMAIDEDLGETLARSCAQGYMAQLKGQELIIQSYGLGQGQVLASPIFADLIRRAERDGAAREELDEYTMLGEDGLRTIKLGVVEPSSDPALYGDELIVASEVERRLVLTSLAQYRRSLVEDIQPEALAIKGIARRLGAGVSSYPIKRLYVLIEGPTQAQDDDLLLEYKEILDVPVLPGLTLYPPRQATSNAERVVTLQRTLQVNDRLDEWLGYINQPPMSLRVRERTKYQKGADVARILEELNAGELTEADLRMFAFDAGRILAAAHGRGKTMEGEPGSQVILAALAQGDDDALEAELAAFVSRYGPVTLRDYERLRALLSAYGPTLGYRFNRPME
jgi:uncharacterized protein (DUF2252 family)